jgi:uncharacterized protein (DUF433 family)
MPDVIATEHQHIECVEGVQGGSPVIKGTRTPVKTIVGYYKLGLSVEEILEGLPHLTPAQVYDALSYYHDHQEEIERDIRESRIEWVLKEQSLIMDKEGIITFDGKA